MDLDRDSNNKLNR